MTDRETIFNLIVEISKALIDSGVIIYERKLFNDKPEFLELNNYRDSLLTLIKELKVLYLRTK